MKSLRRDRTSPRLWYGAIIVMMMTALSGMGRLLAQPRRGPLLIGLATGADGSMELGDFPVFTDAPDCDRFASGRALSGFVAGRLLLPRLFNADLGLSIGLGAAYTTGYFAETPADPLIVLDTALHQPRTIPTEYRLSAIVRDLRLDLLASCSIGGGVALGAGGAFSYRYSADFRQTDNITGDGADRFRSGSRQEMLPGGMAFSPSPITADALLRISYAVPSRSGILVMPEITLRAGLASPVREAVWRTFGAGVGVAMLYDPLAEPERSMPPAPLAVIDMDSVRGKVPDVDTVSQTEAPPRGSGIRASIELFGVGAGGERLSMATVQIFDTRHHAVVPIPMAIRFEHGSAAVAGGYRMLGEEEVGAFSLDSLGLADVDSQALNILGRKLRGDSAATITLAGFSDRAEPQSLGIARAAAVRRYLSDIWNIDTARVLIDQHPTESARRGSGEISRRVVLLSGGEPLLLRLATPIRIDHDLEPPLVALDPHIDADAGVRSWRITLSHQGRTVGSYTSQHPDGAGSGSSEWRVGEEVSGELRDPLIAELTVEDSLGGVKTVSSTIPIVVRRYSREVDSGMAGGMELISYGLFPGSIDSGVVGERNRGAVEEIVGRLRPGATVTVTSSTDEDMVSAARLASRMHDQRAKDRLPNLHFQIGGGREGQMLTDGAGNSGMLRVIVRQPPARNGGRRK